MTKHIFYHGDVISCLRKIPEKSVNTIVTSPPYWGLRDYGVDGQIGLEKTPEEYITKLVNVFREARRVLRDDGTLWLNLGDSYASTTKGSGGASDIQLKNAGSRYAIKKFEHGLKPKDLVGIPWRVAFALQADGWYLRSDIIWSKPNPMPESVKDRPTKAHEYIFLLAKSAKYFYDAEIIREPVKPWNAGRMSAPKMGKHRLTNPYGQQVKKVYDVIKGANRRTVWTIPTQPYPEGHFAAFPPELVRPCILAGSPVRGTVLDPFGGSGTVSMVAIQERRDSIYIDLNREYLDIALRRCGFDAGKFIFDQYEVREG